MRRALGGMGMLKMENVGRFFALSSGVDASLLLVAFFSADTGVFMLKTSQLAGFKVGMQI